MSVKKIKSRFDKMTGQALDRVTGPGFDDSSQRDAATQSPVQPADPITASAPYAIPARTQNEAARLQNLDDQRILDTDREQAFDDLTSLAATICGTPMSMVSFVGDRRQWFKSAVGVRPTVTETPRDVSFCAHAILNPDQMLEVKDATKDPRFAGNPLVQGEMALRYYAGVPILSPEGHALGALCVVDTKPNQLTAEARAAMTSLARQASAQLELRRAVSDLEAQTLADPSTGTFNRRAFDRRLREEWGRHNRQQACLGLLMIDVDHFKQFNDEFGHPAADQALRQVAKAIKRPLRLSDFVARYGGDEFAVILNNAEPAQVIHAAERIVESVQKDYWQQRGITVSVGAAAMTPAGDLDRYALLARADHALFRAGQAGRNRSELFSRWTSSSDDKAATRLFVPYSSAS